MKYIANIVFLLLSIYLAYFFYKKYHKILRAHINEVLSNWPNLPSWLNVIILFFLLGVCFIFQFEFLFESIIVWFFLLIILPFLYLRIKNIKIYNVLSVTTLILTSFFSITLFFNMDNSREIIGNTFISNYSVYYKTEYYQTRYDESEIEVAYVNTGNKVLDFILESIFPFVYRALIFLVMIYSLLLNIFLKEKNKIIRENK